MGVFINFSNHPSSKWSKEQIDAALKYGALVDVEFPKVNPAATEEDIKVLGDECVKKILSLSPNIVMCQGEFTLTYYVVDRLKENGVQCVSACSERVAEEHKAEDGTLIKSSIFKFVSFRSYI